MFETDIMVNAWGKLWGFCHFVPVAPVQCDDSDAAVDAAQLICICTGWWLCSKSLVYFIDVLFPLVGWIIEGPPHSATNRWMITNNVPNRPLCFFRKKVKETVAYRTSSKAGEWFESELKPPGCLTKTCFFFCDYLIIIPRRWQWIRVLNLGWVLPHQKDTDVPLCSTGVGLSTFMLFLSGCLEKQQVLSINIHQHPSDC